MVFLPAAERAPVHLTTSCMRRRFHEHSATACECLQILPSTRPAQRPICVPPRKRWSPGRARCKSRPGILPSAPEIRLQLIRHDAL